MSQQQPPNSNAGSADPLRDLARLSRMIASERDPAAALWQLVTAGRANLSIDRIGIYRFDGEDGCIKRVVGVDVHGQPEFEGQSLPVFEGPPTAMSDVARRKIPYYLSDDVRRDYPEGPYRPGVKAHVIIPIIAGDDLLGALAADNCLTGRPLPEAVLEPLFLYAQLALLPLVTLYQRQARERQELARRRIYAEVLSAVSNGKIVLCEREEIEAEWPSLDTSIPVERDSDVRAVRELVRSASTGAGMQRERVEDFALCASEAATNALLHGRGGRAAVGRQNGAVRIRIVDAGHGIEPENLPRATLMKGWSSANSMGLGFTIINEIADRIYLYTGPNGTSLIVEMNIEPQVRLPDSCNTLLWES